MRWLSHKIALAIGWRFEGELPEVAKMVVIGAPHTSNWDFFLFLAAIHHFDISVRFLGKASLFRWPFGWMFRKVGGIPVDRRQPGGIVGQVKAAFDASDEMILVIAPEGTRSAAPAWKSGFVEIAAGADVPVVFAGVDGDRKTVVIGEAVYVGDDLTEFMGLVRGFYATKSGLRPQGKGPIRLKTEPVTS